MFRTTQIPRATRHTSYGCLIYHPGYRLPRERLPTFITHNETYKVFFLNFVWLLHSHVNESPCNVWVNPFTKETKINRKCAGRFTTHKSDEKYKKKSIVCSKISWFFHLFFLCAGIRHTPHHPWEGLKKRYVCGSWMWIKFCLLSTRFEAVKNVRYECVCFFSHFLFQFNSVIW